MLVAKPSPQLEAGEAIDFGRSVPKGLGKDIHMEADKQSDFGKHHSHKVLEKTYMLPQMGTEKQSDFGKGHSQRALEKAW